MTTTFRYERIVDIDVSRLEPQVACPPTVGNVKPIGEVEGVAIDIAEIGGSTGGRLVDLRVAADRLRGRRVPANVRLQVVPANRSIYKAAMQEGLIQALHDAGAVVFSAQRRFQPGGEHGCDERGRGHDFEPGAEFSRQERTSESAPLPGLGCHRRGLGLKRPHHRSKKFWDGRINTEIQGKMGSDPSRDNDGVGSVDSRFHRGSDPIFP
jgi:hypothetical protein